MITWSVRVDCDSPDRVHAPTALALAGIDWRHLDTGRLVLTFTVDASTLRAATDAALAKARDAMKRTDMDGALVALNVTA